MTMTKFLKKKIMSPNHISMLLIRIKGPINAGAVRQSKTLISNSRKRLVKKAFRV